MTVSCFGGIKIYIWKGRKRTAKKSAKRMIAKHELTQPSKASCLILFLCLIMQLFNSLYFLFYPIHFPFRPFCFSSLRIFFIFVLFPSPPFYLFPFSFSQASIFCFNCTNVTWEPMNMGYEWIFFGCLSVIPRLGKGKMKSHIYPFITVTCWFIGEECIEVWNICCPSHIGTLND